LEFVTVQKIRKELGNDDHHNMDGPRSEFNFIFIRQNHNEGTYSFRKRVIRRMFAFKDSFEFD